jgi:subtilase family serine protease
LVQQKRGVARRRCIRSFRRRHRPHNFLAIPSWQTAAINSSNKGSTTLRNGPDVSANANFTFYVCADQTTCTANSYGGTSFAAPMWAGFIALANQQLASSGQKPLGFINPAIYSQNANSSTYAADFHDVKSGTSGSYSAVTGFDLVTGWGSPTAALITALTGPPAAGFSLSASPTSLALTAGGAGGTSTITSTVTGGFNSAVSLSASAPQGISASFSPASITGTGTSSMSVSVASTVATGSYTITVSGTSGSTVETTTVTVNVTNSSSGFSLSASPTSLAITRGNTGKVTISSAVSGGFNSAVSLSGTGAGSRVTLGFSPTSITGNGTSTMTITVNRRATTGTRTITITGTGGGITKTATVTLTVQ